MCNIIFRENLCCSLMDSTFALHLERCSFHSRFRFWVPKMKTAEIFLRICRQIKIRYSTIRNDLYIRSSFRIHLQSSPHSTLSVYDSCVESTQVLVLLNTEVHWLDAVIHTQDVPQQRLVSWMRVFVLCLTSSTSHSSTPFQIRQYSIQSYQAYGLADWT